MKDTTQKQTSVERKVYVVVLKYWDGSSYTTDMDDVKVFSTKQDAEKCLEEFSHGADSDHFMIETTISKPESKL